jgi:putative transposase
VRCHRAAQRHLVGMKLADALPLLGTDTLDVEAEMGFQKHHRHVPRVTHHRATFRFVAVYNHAHKRWHSYVANLPTSMMKAEHFAAVYAARWEVELLFRELKGNYRIEHMPSASKHLTETLIYAACSLWPSAGASIERSRSDPSSVST